MQALGHVLDADGNSVVCRLSREQLAKEREGHRSAFGATSSIGSILKVVVPGKLLFGSLVSLKSDADDSDWMLAAVELLGEGAAGYNQVVENFVRGVDSYPLPGDPVLFAGEEDFQRMFSPEDEPHVHIGTVFPSASVPAPILFDRLLGRHFAIVGSSGAGKSTLTALLLNRIVARAPYAHVVILDPHGEYSHAFGDRANVWNVQNLQLPYWMMNLEEHCDAFLVDGEEGRATDVNIMAKCLLQARRQNISHSADTKLTADTPIPYRVEDLTDALEEEAGRLERLADASRYTRIRLNIEQSFADPRYRFVFDRTFAENSLETAIAEIVRIPVDGKPISILDLTGVPTEIINVVVSSIARMVLDFAIWTPSAVRPPILFVCEEAHRYLPRAVIPATRSVVKQLERISREGRKYGVCLGLVTQRPSELSDTALSQCGTMISLRLNNIQDQEFLKAAIPEGARSYIDVIGSLKNRECIISGEGVPVTLRVRIDDAQQGERPSSDDALFSEAWNGEGHDNGVVADSVRRWRGGN